VMGSERTKKKSKVHSRHSVPITHDVKYRQGKYG
jgi:hypothetical protein